MCIWFCLFLPWHEKNFAWIWDTSVLLISFPTLFLSVWKARLNGSYPGTDLGPKHWHFLRQKKTFKWYVCFFTLSQEKNLKRWRILSVSFWYVLFPSVSHNVEIFLFLAVTWEWTDILVFPLFECSSTPLVIIPVSTGVTISSKIDHKGACHFYNFRETGVPLTDCMVAILWHKGGNIHY